MNKEIKDIIAKLPTHDQDKLNEIMENLEHSARSHAMAALMVRNMSHNIGQHAQRKEETICQ